MFLQSIKHYWTKAFDFKGMSNISEFWIGILSVVVIREIILAIGYSMGESVADAVSLATLILWIPALALIIRRGRDSDTIVFAWVTLGVFIATQATISYINLVYFDSITSELEASTDDMAGLFEFIFSLPFMAIGIMLQMMASLILLAFMILLGTRKSVTREEVKASDETVATQAE